MGRKNNKRKKEEFAEDYCFLCKDGGMLRICDYKTCLKSFHPMCVGKDDSLLETKERWDCPWHFCLICGKGAKFQCFCCPSAVCGRCLCDAEFAVVKGKRGFCNTCLELVLLIEDKKDTNSNGVKVDFNDRETYEFFFKLYWKLVKEKQGLTAEQVHSSYHLLKNGKNYDIQANNNYGEEDDREFEDDSELTVSDYHDLSDNRVHGRKRKERKISLTKRKGKSKKKEFLGWASKQLTEFLTSSGKSVTQELSQHEVATILAEYCREQQLFDPLNKKKIICDGRLQSLLGRKSVNKKGIHKLLTVHFAENWEQSEDSVEFSTKEDDNNVLVPCKRRRKSSPDRKFEEKEIALNIQKGSFAAIVSRNIKLVYLKRSLVQELAKQLDTFDCKMMGSFVRVKSDPNYYLQKNSHMLVQVKGIKATSEKEDMTSTILLQVSNMINDVPICKLSDDDFTEEECEDLYQRMRSHRLERPTVVELEQKARSLHEDITKHWITKELVLLQNQINRANEKGWRRLLSEYSDRMLLLQMPSEQARLIDEIPEVVADVTEPETVSENSHGEDKGHKALSEGKQQPAKAYISDGHCHHSEFIAIRGEGDKTERNQRFQEVKQSCPETSVPQLLPEQPSAGHTNNFYLEKQHSDAAGEKPNQPADIDEHVKVEKQVEVVVLSDDEVDAKVEVSQQPFDGDHCHHSELIANRVEGDETKRNQHLQEVKQSCPETSVPQLLPQQTSAGQTNSFYPQKQHIEAAGEKLNQPADIDEHVKVEKQVEVVVLSDDEVDAKVAVRQQPFDERDWFCISPTGNMKGPYSMTVLKQWSESSCCQLQFKVWKSGQKPEEAVLLTEAIPRFFNS